MNLNQLPSKKSVFISHASKNFAIADELRALLEKQGISCWIAPRDILASSSYGEEIVLAIEACSVTVLVLTEDANKSRAVANELELSFAKEKVIIPIRIKNLKPSSQIEFYVSNAQWIDAFYTPLKQRVNDIIAVVLAVEQNTKIPSPPPEKKTFFGQMEKKIEQCLRYKILTFMSVFAGLGLIALSSLFLSLRVDQSVQKERELINHDPSLLGLITAKVVDQPSLKSMNSFDIGVAIYNNLKNTPNAEILVQAVIADDAGKKNLVNLKKMLYQETLQDGQTIELKVPMNSRHINFCLIAPHPESKRNVTAKWSYNISVEDQRVILLKDSAPILFNTDSNQVNQCD
jgi:hypothetical protein